MTDKSAKFWNKLADKYSKQPVKDETAYQHKLDKTQEYLNSNMKVLEFACGTGSTAIIHAPKVEHILAIDFSDQMIAIAKNKAAEKNITNITFDATSIEALEAPKGSFDVIMGHNILHLVSDKDAVIQKVMELLKPGGVFISGTVCFGNGFSKYKVLLAVMSLLGKAPTVSFFSKDDLLNSLSNVGFIIDYQWQQKAPLAVPFIIAKKPV